MKVAFRADASIQIGTGHVMRCITLAEELRRQGHRCMFICRSHEGNLAELIISKGFDIHLLNSPVRKVKWAKSEPWPAHAAWLGVSWQTDAEETLKAVGSDTDWLIVDHYALDINWERRLSGSVRQIMVIDDLADRDHDCAVLLDQNLGRQDADYDGLVPPDCRKLIGPNYALLRPEFAELRRSSLKRRGSPELNRILISLGGVDYNNVTGKILEALASSPLSAQSQLDIVMGGAAPHLETIKTQARSIPFEAVVNVNVTDMALRMSKADFSFGGAGSTSWERCCLGLPSLTIILADNQKLIGSALEQCGCAELSTVNEVSNRVKEIVERAVVRPSVLKVMSDNSQSVCDGEGCTRVVDFLYDGNIR